MDEINVPVQLIFGEHDRLSPPSVGEEMVNLIADARLSVLEGAGSSQVTLSDQLSSKTRCGRSLPRVPRLPATEKDSDALCLCHARPPRRTRDPVLHCGRSLRPGLVSTSISCTWAGRLRTTMASSSAASSSVISPIGRQRMRSSRAEPYNRAGLFESVIVRRFDARVERGASAAPFTRFP